MSQKIRPNTHEAVREANNFRLLQNSFRFSGGQFPACKSHFMTKFNRHVLTMPWLGYSFQELGASLDLQDMDQCGSVADFYFGGFSKKTISSLIDRFRKDHINFANLYGIIHGDLFIESPNNIVFNPDLNSLFPIDTEALTILNDNSFARFSRQVNNMESWMYQNLLV